MGFIKKFLKTFFKAGLFFIVVVIVFAILFPKSEKNNQRPAPAPRAAPPATAPTKAELAKDPRVIAAAKRLQERVAKLEAERMTEKIIAEAKKRQALTAKTKADNRVAEYMLASLEAGKYVDENDPQIKDFKLLLDLLEKTYKENRTQISDMTVNAQKFLKDAGVNESLWEIMEGMAQLFPQGAGWPKYQEYGAAYIMVRKRAPSREDAISSLKASIRSLGD